MPKTIKECVLKLWQMTKECDCWYIFDRNDGRTGTVRSRPNPACKKCGGKTGRVPRFQQQLRPYVTKCVSCQVELVFDISDGSPANEIICEHCGGTGYLVTEPPTDVLNTIISQVLDREKALDMFHDEALSGDWWNAVLAAAKEKQDAH